MRRRVVGSLWLAGMAGTALALPYFLPEAGASQAIAALKLLGSVAVVLALAAPLGDYAARRVGLHASWLEPRTASPGAPRRPGLATALRSTLLGLALGLLTLWMDARLPRPAGWHAPVQPTHGAFAELASSVFGGVTEEILVSWFGLSVTALVLRSALRAIVSDERPLPPVVFWLAAFAAAAALGVAHLPGALASAPLGLGLVARVLLVEGAPGLAFGWLFRRRGIEMAMLAHLASDLLRHALVVAGRA